MTCVVEDEHGSGAVLDGSVRSLRLVLADAARHPESEVLVRLASGPMAWLRVRDEDGAVVPWRVRDVAW